MGCASRPASSLNQASTFPAGSVSGSEELLEDIALAKRALEEIHPGYTRYTEPAALDSAWQMLAESAREGLTAEAFYVELSRLLAMIRCDHTKAELSDAMKEARVESASFFPFRIIEAGGEVFVFSAGADSGVEAGDRLVAIDGVAMTEVISRIYPLISVDGNTLHARGAGFESSGEVLGSAFEHFYPLVFGSWNEATVSVERGGARMDVVVSPTTWTGWQALPWQGGLYRSDFADAVQLNFVNETTAHLKIDTFVNYRRPVDPSSVYGPIFAELRRKKTERLIVDLRLNGGGSDDAQLGLLAHLINAPHAFYRSAWVKTINVTAYSDFIKTWDRTALSPDPSLFRAESGGYRLLEKADPTNLQPLNPMEPHFEGSVIALTSRRNASAVTTLLATLREQSNAVLVGEPTGGSSEGPTAGILFFLELPQSGITIRIPWLRQELNIERPEPGLGVTPDIVVKPSASDRLAGADPVLRAAIEGVARAR